LGIPIIQQPTTGDNYRAQFVKMLHAFKQDGIEGGVFGDIDFNAHLEWIEGVCKETGMKSYLPLWLEDQRKLVEELIGAGFIAVIVAVKADFFGPETLGKVIDRDFLDSLPENVTPCGEAGEFHSLVIDGPVFKKQLEITSSRKETREGRHFLDITGVKLTAKRLAGKR
jgi:uncharacterized protein (TIGR00290 family)